MKTIYGSWWTLDRNPWQSEGPGSRRMVQRPGEAQVMRDDFETLDTGRWSMRVGDPSVENAMALVGERSLLLPSGGSAITARLSDPIGSGRLEVAYHDGGQVVENQRWFVDLTFRARDGDQVTIRTVAGWADETISVESDGGPALVIQRLLRRDGWHRLSVRFRPDSTELAIDGNELAYAKKGPGGVLEEIRLATESVGNAKPVSDLAVRLDDLSLARFGEPSGRLEIEPSADDVRFSTGDQLFGRVPSAGPDHLNVLLDPGGPTHEIPWSEVAGLYFRRAAAQSQPVEGQIVRVEWHSGPGDDPRDLDSVEGALKAFSDAHLDLDVPFVGALRVPVDRVTKIEPVSRVRRIIIDPTAHHLGDDPRKEPFFDPPQPEDAPLEIPFELTIIPSGPARLALDVVDVLGVSGSTQFSADVRAGKYRTHLKINGQAIEDLNTAVHMPNVTPARVFVPITPNLLKKGRNVVRIDQDFGSEERDNLELLGVAIEWPIDSSSRTNQP